MSKTVGTGFPSCANRVLLALSAETRAAILSAAVLRPLTEGDVLYQPGDRFTHTIFIRSGVVSEVSPLDHGRWSESSTIGNESIVGMVGTSTPRRSSRVYVVRISGDALFVPTEVVDDLSMSDPTVRDFFARHREAILNASLQSTACANSHAIAERTARWLLQAHDRVDGDRFALRQATLAEALGVRRASISVVCSALAERDVIGYVRGLVSIENRSALEACACGCYRVIRRGFEDALSPPGAREESP